MKFVATPLPGVVILEPEPIADARGLFAREYSEDLFSQRGLPTHWPQWNVSFNERAGTLRGLHYQRAPGEEPKLVRCTRGRIWDVAVDLRPDSPHFLKWFGTELNEENRATLYIPPGFAHGFQTLVDRTEVLYHMGAVYRPEFGTGARWDDPKLAIAWPIASPILSDRDASYPDLAP